MHRIDLSLADTEPYEFRERLDLSAEEGLDVVSAGVTEVSGVLEKSARGYHLAGEVRGEATLRCVRCLVDFPFSFFEELDVSLLPRDAAPREDETRLDRDDLNVRFYDEPTLDLRDLAAEQLQLALPMSAICREACRGLCPSCGRDRNLDPCDCKIDESDSRWAPLLDWRPRE